MEEEREAYGERCTRVPYDRLSDQAVPAVHRCATLHEYEVLVKIASRTVMSIPPLSVDTHLRTKDVRNAHSEEVREWFSDLIGQSTGSCRSL